MQWFLDLEGDRRRDVAVWGHYQDVTRPEPTWRTLRLVDGRLWIGDRPRFLRRPRARLEPDVLALVDPDGSEAGYRV